MYHSRFKGSHYEAGYKWGKSVLKNKGKITDCHTFKITKERKDFAKECISVYKKYFPEILDEIKGIADGQKISYEDLYTFLFSMYCFEFENKCTCFVVKKDDEIIFGRNSDFLTEIEKLYDSCYYKLEDCYSFIGNTTAFVEMEDGVNEYGLAAGLTFVYPKIRKAGLNAGMLVRYFLEKCRTVKDVLEKIKNLPIASAQTITLADKTGDMAVIECNPEKVKIIYPEENYNFIVSANNFNSREMREYKNPEGINDWNSEERYRTAYEALKENKNNCSFEFAVNLLSGKYGFMCQYDRKKGADTVWSSIYILNENKIYRAEGNPSRKKFREDKRLKFK